jgi:hypothetical protein
LLYEKGKDLIKLSKLLQITEIFNQVLKPSKVQKQTRIPIYSIVTIPTLPYGSQTRKLKEQCKARISAA